jgi:hypothetical protein
MNNGNAPKPQPQPRPEPGPGQATPPRDVAREALQQSLDRRW